MNWVGQFEVKSIKSVFILTPTSNYISFYIQVLNNHIAGLVKIDSVIISYFSNLK